MAIFILMNTITAKTNKFYAGDLVNDAVEDVSAIQSAGGVLLATGNAKLDAAAQKCRELRKNKAGNEVACDALMAAAFADSASVATGMQAGTGTLAAGTVTISGVRLTASSRIIVTMKDAGAGAITGFADFEVPAASRNVGAGSFVVRAVDAAKAVIATAVCTFDYVIIG